ncbi:variable large family protein [Borrelia persica]|uniref:variable large family protein n=1 Tax=Borrelia persica TaxID=44448 RepID=UPI0004676692|nr:variable large family protein [Borrelia persica]
MKKLLGLLIVVTLFVGCDISILGSKKLGINNQNSLLNEAIKIGQEIREDLRDKFGSIGEIISHVSGWFVDINANDNRSKIKDHFHKLEKGLEAIKRKLEDEVNEDESVIVGVNKVIDEITVAVKKLAESTGDNIGIGEINNSSGTKASTISNKESVAAMISGIKDIVEIAEKSHVEIKRVNDGSAVVGTAGKDGATYALNGGQGGADKGAGSKLVEEVSKADAWAMINKIKNATTTSENISDKNDNDAGKLITGTTSQGKSAAALTNADFAAAVALKAMSKNGKFAACEIADDNNDEYSKKIKEAAANAVNKVLGVLDVIIMQTLQMELSKIKHKIK